MPFIPEAEVDAHTKGNSDDGIPGMLDPSSPPKTSAVLLAPFTPVVFVEAQDSSLNVDLEANKYEPINVPTPRESGKTTSDNQTSEKTSTPAPQGAGAASSTPDARAESTFVQPLDTLRISFNWPFQMQRVLCGLENLGNSCFMNSTLQILMHTPPLLNILVSHHKAEQCPLQGDFCFACSLRTLSLKIWSSKTSRAKMPTEIFDNLRKIAPSFRRGRQEDAHEFLRFGIDALQLSAQKGVKEVPEKLAETSWVYRLFGGKFRSRVNCHECNHNSDTFDTLLDLSVDVGRCETLAGALRKFAGVEKLEGKNKYKCEKCNKPVNASKQITVHSAPQALCIQLKRFTPWGRKLTHQVEYPRDLSLMDAMSKDQTSPKYELYGIICHAGGTPNSGHYYAYVKNPPGSWSRMNDEDATTMAHPPYSHKNAYMLFYMRQPPSMASTIAEVTTSHKPPVTLLSGQKRKREDLPFDANHDEDIGEAMINRRSSSPARGSSPSEDKINPSPAKRARHEGYIGTRPITNVASNSTLKSRYNFVNPRRAMPTVHSKPNLISQKPIQPMKDLGLPYGSSDAEDANDPVEPTQPSQTDLASEPPVSSLPASRESSPEPSAPRIHRAWQKPDSNTSSSSDSRKRKTWETDKNEVSKNPPLKRQKSSDDTVPTWMSEQDGASRKSLGKTYQSNAKKERRDRIRHQNPYKMLGIPTRPPGVKFGAKAARKPGAL